MWKSEQGFTVNELLIAVAILSVLSAQAYNAFLSSSQRLVLQSRIVEMQTDARAAMVYGTGNCGSHSTLQPSPRR